MQEIHKPELILQFIDTTLKTHINRSSAFYKSSTNQKEICNLLESALKLEMEMQVEIKKKQLDEKPNTNEKNLQENKKDKTKKQARNKIIIEYDF